MREKEKARPSSEFDVITTLTVRLPVCKVQVPYTRIWSRQKLEIPRCRKLKFKMPYTPLTLGIHQPCFRYRRGTRAVCWGAALPLNRPANLLPTTPAGVEASQKWWPTYQGNENPEICPTIVKIWETASPVVLARDWEGCGYGYAYGHGCWCTHSYRKHKCCTPYLVMKRFFLSLHG